MTVRALGLDLSLAATGLALTDGTCRTIRPQADADEPARRLHELAERILLRLHNQPADIAVLEGYVPGGKGGPLVMFRLAELGGPVRVLLFERNIPYVEISPTALKKFATGNGGASKDDVVNAAERYGATVANDNEADAWFLRLAALQRYTPNLDLPALTDSITTLPWPTLAPVAVA